MLFGIIKLAGFCRLFSTVFALGFCLCLSWDLKAQEAPVIWAKAGNMPRVHCDLAKQITAMEMWTVIGEPYEIYTPPGEACESDPVVADENPYKPIIVMPPGVNPVAPFCNCPTTRQVGYWQRLESLNQNREELFLSWEADQQFKRTTETMNPADLDMLINRMRSDQIGVPNDGIGR